MFNLVEKRRWYFLVSAILLLTGIVAMVYSGISQGSALRLGIDFSGGSLLQMEYASPVSLATAREAVTQAGYPDAVIQIVDNGQSVSIRTKPMEVSAKEALKTALATQLGEGTELRFESVGPTVGAETTRAAVLAILAASLAILIFVAIAFRKVPNAVRYGVCAIAKMFHDVLVILGLASIMGLIAGWEVDSLFLTAMITVIGFSVQDVIVVFDRIRENHRRRKGEPFETIVNRSLLETLHRSLATQLNAMFVMVAVIFFGGATIQHFMIVMLVGMVTGTFSSLFFAVPLLVAWEKGDIGRLFGRAKRTAS
jgi:preprotein translocase SecF subunit